MIGIVQMFERLGWERVLEWYEDITSRAYLASVCEWLASLRFENEDGPPHTWKLVGATGRGQMVMSFETMNCIACFDLLRDDEYTYYTIDQFLDIKMNAADPGGMGQATLPHSDGGAALRIHLSVEGKILQNISLEDIMVRFGDRGKVKASDCRVIHSLLFGTPKLSWRHINRLPMEALWVSKPVDQICFASMKQHWKIIVVVFGHQYTVSDDQGHRFQYTDPSAAQEAAREEEMIDEENEDEPPGPRGPRQQYARPHR
ncbi:hypothetical protein Hanom_Chr09g00859131 [Helianthus anomalus]